jgi:hypothetical protein
MTAPTAGNTAPNDFRQGLKTAIWSVTSDNQVRQAMLMGAQLESGMNPNAVGDSGHSFGVFQIYLPAHPDMTEGKAKSISDATRFMLPSYASAVRRVPDGLWNSDPGLASATAAFYAERPKVMYPTARIRSGWPIVLGLMQGAAQPGVVTPGPGDVKSKLPDFAQGVVDFFDGAIKGVGGAVGGALEGVSGFVSFIGNIFAFFYKILKFLAVTLFLPKTWARVGAFIIGCACVFSGLFLFFVGSSPITKVMGGLK